MKKITLLLAACNLMFMVGCGSSEKRPGEEYYDPEYKPKTNQTAADATENNTTAATTAPTDNTTTAAANEADEATAAEMPNVTEPKAAGATIEGAPAIKDEVQIAVQPKDKLQASPVNKFEKGKNLIAKSDCLACHKDDAKLVGPAYVEVANKYENNAKNVDFLVNKIIKGGAGSWGQIPMSPHPNLSTGDAREMVNYILSLKK
jgi:cytochrome c